MTGQAEDLRATGSGDGTAATGLAVRAAARAASLSRRRFLAAAAALSAAVCSAAVTGRTARAADEAAGLLVLPRGRDVALVTPDGVDDRPIISLQQGEFIADVALSLDRSRVAFGYFTARTGDGPGGSDIVIAPVHAGAERTVVVPRDRPGMLLAAPQWSPDGDALVFEAVGLTATGQAGVSVEWVEADGSGRRTIAETARYPSFSPDGQAVISTRALPTGDALWEHPAVGGVPRELIPAGQFLVIAYPRYSPDGARVAFAGVSDTLPPLPMPPLPETPAVPVAPVVPKLLFGAGVGAPSVQSVLAHGFPASPFLMPATGGEPYLLAEMPIDDAAIAWSPDGSVLAVSGASGLFMVNTSDGTARRLTEYGSFGAIDWR